VQKDFFNSIGQNLLLPQRNSKDRFTAFTGHCRSNSVINSDQPRSRFIRDAQHTPNNPEVA
jgi:hypothetical protein